MKKLILFNSILLLISITSMHAQCSLTFQLDSLNVIGMKECVSQYYHDGKFYVSENFGYNCLDDGPQLHVFGKITNNSRDKVIITSYYNIDSITQCDIVHHYQFQILIKYGMMQYVISTPLAETAMWTEYFEHADSCDFMRPVSTVNYCLEVSPFMGYFRKRYLDDTMSLIQLGMKFQDFLSEIVLNADSFDITLCKTK